MAGPSALPHRVTDDARRGGSPYQTGAAFGRRTAPHRRTDAAHNPQGTETACDVPGNGSGVIRRLLAALARRRCTGDDAGRVTAFATVITLALVAVAGLVLDGGVALSAKVQVLDIAQAAARAGAQQLDLTLYRTTSQAQLNPDRAASVAEAWLASAGVQGEAGATTTTVTVTVYRTTNTQLLQLVGVRQLHVSASVTATAVQGVTGPNT
jgi:Flp pilus assembly protein TadG